MKKKVLAVLLALAMASSSVPGTLSYASEGTEMILSGELAAEDESTAGIENGIADLQQEETPLNGSQESTQSESAAAADFLAASDDKSEAVREGDEEILTDDFFTYRKISDTEAAVTGILDENEENLTIPSELTAGDDSYIVSTVDKDALSGSAAQSIGIPASVTEFGTQNLSGLKSISVSEDNTELTVKDGVLFTKAKEDERACLLLYPAAADAEYYVIPENTGEIAESAFANVLNLKILVITDGVRKIGTEAVGNAANPLEIAFALKEMPEEISENAFVLDGADGNVFYFENEEALGEINEIQPAFVYSPAMFDEDGSLLEDYSDAVKFVTDGIPEHIRKLHKDPDELIGESDDASGGDSAGKDEGKDTEETVGAAAKNRDAKIASGFYSMKNNAVDKYLKVRNAGIKDGTDTYLAGYGSDMGATLNIVPLGGGLYKIVAACSNKALTLAGAPGENVTVMQKAYTGAANQKWYIRETKAGSGIYRFCPSENDSYAVGTLDEGTASATPIVLRKVSSAATQAWSLISRADPTKNHLANGIYSISSAISASKAVEVAGGGKNDGANVQIGSGSNAACQQFILRYLGYSNLFRVVNVNSNKALDTAGSKTADKTNVQQADQNNTSVTQIWRIVKNSEGSYVIFNAGANKVLDIADGQADDGANVQIAGWGNTKSQKWNITAVSGKSAADVDGKDAEIKKGWYTLTSARVDRSIAVRNAALEEDANVLIQAPGLGENSYFYIEPTGNGKYVIRAFCSNKVLTNVWGADSIDAGNVVQKTDANLSTQRWYIRVSKKNKSYLSIVSSSDQNYVLSLKENKPGFGTSVTAALSAGLNGQRWKLKPVENPNISIPYNNTTYKIETAGNNKLVLSTEGQSKKSEANIQLMTKVNGAGEFWDFHKVGYGNLFTITNSYTGLALDAKNAGTADGTNVWQYAANNTNAQLWRIMPVDAARTKFTIINAVSCKALDLYGANKAAGTNIQLYTQNGTDAQEWAFSRANINTYVPVNTAVTVRMKGNKSMLMEVRGGSSDNGAAIQMYTESANTDQCFVFKKQSDGSYKIQNVASSKFLTVSGGNVVSTAGSGADSQRWLIQASGDNDASFKIINKGTGMALTGANAKNAGVVQAAFKNAGTQKFFFDTPELRSGWQQVDSNWKYYDENGNCLRNAFRNIDNHICCFDKDGNVLTGWKEYDGFYYYFKGRDGREETDNRPYVNKLYKQRAGKNKPGYTCPDCPYRYTIDTARCVVTFFTKFPGTNNFNVPVVAFLCSPGTVSTPTDPGTRKIGKTEHYINLMGNSWGQYGTEILAYTVPAGGGPVQWTNNGEFMHSIACGQANDHNLDNGTYNLLGTRQSHGCVRLGVRNAYWVWNFVPKGTEGTCGMNLGAPLKTLPQPVMVNYGVDPTDPGYTGNWGYTDTYAATNTNGQFILRG